MINPRTLRPGKARLPLSLLHLAAVLDGRRPWKILDGNLTADLPAAAVAELARAPYAMVGVTVMPGPQVAPAIAVSAAIRGAFPGVPIVWGGYFPTLYPDSAVNAPYVDFVVRGQGEQALLDLLDCIEDDPTRIEGVRNVTWKHDGRPVHNPAGPVASPDEFPRLPYDRLESVDAYMLPSFLGARTAVHQASIGCRYKCSFCGVVSMWNGKTKLEAPDRLYAAGSELKSRWGADAFQFYDHNFFDREATSLPLLDALGKLSMPFWCFARADTLASFPASTWEKIRKAQLKMAFMGAEAASEEVLLRMRKGSRTDHTLEVAARCRENGVIPEFSFILGGPEDPEAEIEKTFSFIRRVKTINPAAEIILYFYSPTPQRERTPAGQAPRADALPMLSTYGPSGPALPTSPEEWTDPRWVSWVCHLDAPWLTDRLRQRVRDFARVLECRFPTVQDYRTPRWGKAVLSGLARWRYSTSRYDAPWELELARRFIPLKVPQQESL